MQLSDWPIWPMALGTGLNLSQVWALMVNTVDQWSDFKTYFRFIINPEGKISRLDMGQAATKN